MTSEKELQLNMEACIANVWGQNMQKEYQVKRPWYRIEHWLGMLTRWRSPENVNEILRFFDTNFVVFFSKLFILSYQELREQYLLRLDNIRLFALNVIAN